MKKNGWVMLCSLEEMAVNIVRIPYWEDDPTVRYDLIISNGTCLTISGTYTYFMNQSAAHVNQKTMYNTSRLERLHSRTNAAGPPETWRCRECLGTLASELTVRGKFWLVTCKFRAKRGTNAIELGSWAVAQTSGVLVLPALRVVCSWLSFNGQWN